MALEFEQVARANFLQLFGFLAERHNLVQGFCTETLLTKDAIQ